MKRRSPRILKSISEESKSLSKIEPDSYQKDKAKFARIKRVYGLSKEEYDSLNLGHCPICLRDWSDAVKPVVDHDHVEHIVRGLVCRYCNHRRIGHHRDWELVFRIGNYLKGPFKYMMPPKEKKKRKLLKKKVTK